MLFDNSSFWVELNGAEHLQLFYVIVSTNLRKLSMYTHVPISSTISDNVDEKFDYSVGIRTQNEIAEGWPGNRR